MKQIKISIKILLIVFVLIGANSCKVGPNFQKTSVKAPDNYRFSVSNDSVTDLKWQDIYKDPTLVELINSALLNNFDARIAASRIMESRYYLGYTKAGQYPNFSYNGGVNLGNSLGTFPAGNDAKLSFRLTGNLNWELDFWGKYRRATEVAQADLAPSEFGLKAIQISLNSEVANTYFLFLDYKNRLDIAISTLSTRKESTRIIGERYNKGIVPEIDLNQAQIQEDYAAGRFRLMKGLLLLQKMHLVF